MQPKCVHTADVTITFDSPASLTVGSSGSNLVSAGKFSYSFTSSLVSLLMKTGIPFHTIYITSAGGSSPMSTPIYVSLSYLFHPFNLPITPIAYNLAKDNKPP